MLDKFKKKLQNIADRLTGRKADLAKSRRRHKVFLDQEEKLHEKQVRAEQHGHIRRAEAFKRRAERAHKKTRYWTERIRRDDKAIDALISIESNLDREVNEWLKTHGAHLIGHNKIRGGNYEERAFLFQTQAMINYRNGTSVVGGSSYYSQSGAPRVYSHMLWHYPRGHIYDCSTYADGGKFITGDPSPSGPHGFTEGGWTGTELENCKRVTGKVQIGDLVVYLGGSMGSHHVEVVFNPEKKQTTGHGDAAINIGCNGSWDLFGDGNYVIVRPPREHKDHLIEAHHEHLLPA